MEYCELTEKQYREFWEKSEQKTFLSAPEISHLNNKRTTAFFGVLKEKKVVAAAMVLGTKRRFFGYDFWAPRGILVDYGDKKILKFFIEHLRRDLKQRGGYIFRMEPNVELIERDIDGKIVEGGYDNRNYVKNLKELGFSRVKYMEGFSHTMWEFALTVKGKSKEDVWSEMKNKAKRPIKQAQTLGAEIRELKRDELKKFYEIMAATAGRKNFKIRGLDYFEKLYDLYHKNGEIQFVAVMVQPKKCLKSLEKQKEEILAQQPQTATEKRNHQDAIKSLEARTKKISEAFADLDEREVMISAGAFFLTKPEILYFIGGTPDKFIKLDGQYLLQWAMIQKAIEEGYDQYNFYGLVGDDDNYFADGIYEFKRGFSGRVIQRVGEFELPLSKKFYLRKVLKKIKRGAKK